MHRLSQCDGGSVSEVGFTLLPILWPKNHPRIVRMLSDQRCSEMYRCGRMGHLARQGLWKSATSCCAFLLRTAGQPGVYVKNRLGVHFQRFAYEIDIDQAERMEVVHAEIIGVLLDGFFPFLGTFLIAAVVVVESLRVKSCNATRLNQEEGKKREPRTIEKRLDHSRVEPTSFFAWALGRNQHRQMVSRLGLAPRALA